MTRPTPPLDKYFPNKESAIEEGMPLLCSILFGFSGLYFAAVCIVKDSDLGERTFANLLVVGPYIASSLDFSLRSAIMFLSAICCASFYGSVVSALYAKMVNVHAVASAAKSPEQQAADELILSHLRKRRSVYILISLITFNFGIFVLPLSLLVFLPNKVMATAIVLYPVAVFGLWRVIEICVKRLKFPEMT